MDLLSWLGLSDDNSGAPQMQTQGLLAQPQQQPDPYADAFQQQPISASPKWAQAMQLIGATMRDVGNQGRSDFVGQAQDAMQRQASQRAQMAAGQRVANSMLPDFAPVNVTPRVQTSGQNDGADIGGTVTRPGASDILASIAQGIPRGVGLP